MSENVWVVLITLLLTGAPITAWALFRKEKRQAPIDVRTAETANQLAQAQASDLLVGQALKVSDAVSRQLEEVRATAAALRVELDEVRGVQIKQGRAMDVMSHRFTLAVGWVTDIHERWDEHRQRDAPPPLPADLRDVLLPPPDPEVVS